LFFILNLTQNQSLVSKTTSETRKLMEWNFFVWIAFFQAVVIKQLPEIFGGGGGSICIFNLFGESSRMALS
jgi:hypothetical protein